MNTIINFAIVMCVLNVAAAIYNYYKIKDMKLIAFNCFVAGGLLVGIIIRLSE